MRVVAEVEEDELEGDHAQVSGLRVTCPRCGREVEVFGTDESSARRAGVELRDGCLLGEQNFYIVEIP